MLEKSSSLDESLVIELGSGFVGFYALVLGSIGFLSIPEIQSFGVSILKYHFYLSF